MVSQSMNLAFCLNFQKSANSPGPGDELQLLGHFQSISSMIILSEMEPVCSEPNFEQSAN